MEEKELEKRITHLEHRIAELQMKAELAAVYAKERRGRHAAVRILEDARERVRLVEQALEEALTATEPAQVRELVIEMVTQGATVAPGSIAERYLHTIVEESQRGGSVSSVTKKLRCKNHRLNGVLRRSGLPAAGEVLRLTKATTAVAMLRRGEHSARVAKKIGFRSEVNLSNMLKDVFGCRLKEARRSDPKKLLRTALAS